MFDNVDNQFSTSVMVIGLKKVDFTDKDNKLVQGLTIMFATEDNNNSNLYGLNIDKNKSSVWVPGLDRLEEFTMLKFPYSAKIISKNVGLNNYPKFVDIKVS